MWKTSSQNPKTQHPIIAQNTLNTYRGHRKCAFHIFSKLTPTSDARRSTRRSSLVKLCIIHTQYQPFEPLTFTGRRRKPPPAPICLHCTRCTKPDGEERTYTCPFN